MSEEREMEARERVLMDPDMLDIIFGYLEPRSARTVTLALVSR